MKYFMKKVWQNMKNLQQVSIKLLWFKPCNSNKHRNWLVFKILKFENVASPVGNNHKKIILDVSLSLPYWQKIGNI